MKKSRVVEGEDDSSSGEETSATRRLSMKGRTSALRNNRRSVAFRQAPATLRKEEEEEEQPVPETIPTPEEPPTKVTEIAEVTSPATPSSGEPEALPPSITNDDIVLRSSSQLSPSLSPTSRPIRATQKCPPLEKAPVVVVKRRVPRSTDTCLPATTAESMLSIGRELNPTTMGGGGDGSVDKPSRGPSSPVAAASSSLVWLNPRYDSDASPGGPMSEAAWEARHGVPGRLGLSAHRAIRAELEHVYGKGVHEGFLQPVGAVTQKSRGQVAVAGRAMRSVQSQCDAMNGYILGLWSSNAVKISTKTHHKQ